MSTLSVLRLPPAAYSTSLCIIQPLAVQFFLEVYSEFFAMEGFLAPQANNLA